MRDSLVPVVELHSSGEVGEPVFVPLHELDSMVGELSSDFDFGLGQFTVDNRHELGKLAVNFKAPKLTMPKLSFSIGKGSYTPLKPATKPTKKAPVRAAVKRVQAQKKKPVVIARKKPASQASSAADLKKVYSELKRQGKIINLLATKTKVTAEHKSRMSQDGFRKTVMDLLRKIDKQCAGDASGNYFARWNKLKAATGVSVHER